MRYVLRTALLIAAWFLLAAPMPSPSTACGNGDFEAWLDPREWSGGHGFVLRNGEPHFGSFTAGLIPGMANGPLSAASSHQTWIDATEPDPIAGISRVAPGGSTHALRIGNSFCDAHADMLEKTFEVSAEQSVIRFSYAVVLQRGGHDPTQESSFLVRVLDASGVPIPGVVQLFGVSDKLIAGDSSSLVQKPGTDVFYRDWTRASIDLSRYVGKTVTVQLITEDCSLGGHYGYAYVDDFCDSDCGGRLRSAAPSTDCGKVDLCVVYALPEVAGATGSVVLRLDLMQDDFPRASILSPVLTGGTSYCFTIDPETLPLSPERPFRFVVTGTFSAGGNVCDVESVSPITEHHVDCPDAGNPPDCVIANGDFEAGNDGFTSAYTLGVGGSVRPGQYAVLNAAQAVAVASTWKATSHASCDAAGKFLVVNGATGRGGHRTVWSQTVPVIAGEAYRFSANFRNLPICGFDVPPKVELWFSTPADDGGPFVIDTPLDPCHWQQESRVLRIPAGVTTLTCEIRLHESEDGDGNDLAIDDISLCLEE